MTATHPATILPPDSGEPEPEGLPEIPAEVREQLASALPPNESLAGAIECDLDLEGQFASTWLFVTDDRLGLFLQNGAGTGILREVPAEQILKVERETRNGSVFVEAHTESQTVVLARASNARLDALSEGLEALRRELPNVELPKRSYRKPRKDKKALLCAKCGNPIPPWNDACVECLPRHELLLRLLSRVRRYWVYIGLGLVMMVMIQAADLAGPLLQAQLIDHALKGRNIRLLWKIVALLVGLNVASQAIGAVRSYMMAWFGQKAVYDLRAELYEHIQKLSISFYDSKQTGWIMDRVTSDTMNLQDFLTDALQDFIRDVVTVLGILVIMLSWNWRLALITLVPTPFIALASRIFMKKSQRLWHRVWRKRSRIASLLSDVVPGVRVVKAFTSEHREADKFNSRNDDYVRAAVGAARAFALFGPITGLLATAGYISVWLYGGTQAIQHPSAITVGELVGFIQYLWRFYQPVQSLSRMVQRIQQSATAAQRVFEVLDTSPDLIDPHDGKVMPTIRGKVEFEHVVFGYEPHQEVLNDVSFTAEPGEMIGLVGPSGAGKSTAINLLMRFYDVLDGSIRIDGIDLRDVTLQSLREQIGVVLQEPFLFHGTITENIGYGRPGASRREIIEASRAANCHEFVLRFPDGYDTVVGERGARLSGGERQRISIARAILKNPRILILDEATSSVDTETEGQIRQALERLVRGRTTIAIAHRFSTLRNANRLVVLEKGKVAEIGTHSELLEMENGLFRRLSEQQAQLSQIVAVGG